MTTTRTFHVESQDGEGDYIVEATDHEAAVRDIYQDREDYRLVELQFPADGEPRTVGFVVKTTYTIERAR